MKLRWKIFRVANITEVAMMIILFSVFIGANNFSLKDNADLVGITIFSFMVLLVVWNCISNVLLLRAYKHPDSFSLPNPVRFWIVGILFLIACLLLVISIAAAYAVSQERAGRNKYELYGFLLVVSWILLIALNGIYIFVVQIVLFSSAKKMRKESNLKLVAEIGGEPA